MVLNARDQIIDYLVNNQEHLQETCNKFEFLCEENEFKPLFVQQQKDFFKEQIVDEITKSLACDPESVYTILEEIDLEEYLGICSVS